MISNGRTISFIIPVLDCEATIGQCLKAIIAIKNPGDQIIVVDNGSSDATREVVSKFSDVTLLTRPGVTISSLRNVGARLAVNDVLGFVDADCVLSSGWRDNVLNTLSIPMVVATGSKVDIPSDAGWIERAWYRQKKLRSGPVNYINSGNLAIKKNVFWELCGFDDALVTGEDSELCLRIRISGYIVYENPGARAEHLGNPKTLLEFYKKEVWHGLGMLGTFRKCWYDKPFLMTLFFLTTLVTTIISLAYMLFHGINGAAIGGTISIVIGPLVTAGMRMRQFRIRGSYFPLSLLYFVYYLARTKAFMSICLSKASTILPGGLAVLGVACVGVIGRASCS